MRDVNIFDILFGPRVVSPLATSSAKDVGVSMVQDFGKNYIYNPETKKILPNSMMNNAPDLTQKQLTPQDIQLLISLIAPAPKTGKVMKVKPMYETTHKVVNR